MASNFELIFQIGANLSRSFNNTLNNTSRRLRDLNDASVQARKNMEGFRTAGAAAMRYGAAGLAALAIPVKTAIDFEAAMSKVGAVSRASAEDLKKLENQALQLGATTAWSASQAAEGMTFLAMAGFSVNDTIAAMPGMLSLASAGGVELGVAADIASNILTGFGLKATDMARVSDVMTNAFTRSNVTVDMLGETMKYVAPVAAGLGVTIEETAAMTGKLGDAGIQGSMAGTALRAIMSRMAAPPKMAADALKELNIQTKDARGNLRPMAALLEELSAKTKDMGNAKRAELFKAIAGEEAFSALSVLADQAGSGNLKTFIENMKETGSANRVAAQMLDNTKGAIVSLMSALEGLSIQIGNALLPSIRSLANYATMITSGIIEWSKSNPELAATLVKIVAAVSALAVIIGGLSVAIWAISGPIGTTIALFKMLGGTFALAASPILIAIGLLVVAAWMLYSNWDAVVGGFNLLVANMSAVALDYWNGIVYGAQMLWSNIKAFFNSGIANISATILNWSPMGLFYRAFSAVMSWFGVDLPAKFTGFGKMMIQGLINGITSMASVALEKVKSIANGITNAVRGAFNIHSPSRVFAEIGKYNMQGLAQGMDKNAILPQKSANAAALNTVPDLRKGLASSANGGGFGGGSVNITQNITVQGGGAGVYEQAKKGASDGAADLMQQLAEIRNYNSRVSYG